MEIIFLFVLFWIPIIYSLIYSFLWDTYYWSYKDFKFEGLINYIKWDRKSSKHWDTKYWLKTTIFLLMFFGFLFFPEYLVLFLLIGYIHYILIYFQIFDLKVFKIKRLNLSRLLQIVITTVFFISTIIFFVSITIKIYIQTGNYTYSEYFGNTENIFFGEDNRIKFYDIYFFLSLLMLFSLLIDISMPIIVLVFGYITYPIYLVCEKLIIFIIIKRYKKILKENNQNVLVITNKNNINPVFYTLKKFLKEKEYSSKAYFFKKDKVLDIVYGIVKSQKKVVNVVVLFIEKDTEYDEFEKNVINKITFQLILDNSGDLNNKREKICNLLNANGTLIVNNKVLVTQDVTVKRINSYSNKENNIKNTISVYVKNNENNTISEHKYSLDHHYHIFNITNNKIEFEIKTNFTKEFEKVPSQKEINQHILVLYLLHKYFNFQTDQKHIFEQTIRNMLVDFLNQNMPTYSWNILQLSNNNYLFQNDTTELSIVDITNCINYANKLLNLKKIVFVSDGIKNLTNTNFIKSLKEHDIDILITNNQEIYREALKTKLKTYYVQTHNETLFLIKTLNLINSAIIIDNIFSDYFIKSISR